MLLIYTIHTNCHLPLHEKHTSFIFISLRTTILFIRFAVNFFRNEKNRESGRERKTIISFNYFSCHLVHFKLKFEKRRIPDFYGDRFERLASVILRQLHPPNRKFMTRDRIQEIQKPFLILCILFDVNIVVLLISIDMKTYYLWMTNNWMTNINYDYNNGILIALFFWNIHVFTLFWKFSKNMICAIKFFENVSVSYSVNVF